MSTRDLTTLIHLIGFLTGVALYGLLVVMTVRVRTGQADRIPIATALLGLVWNSVALAIYAFRDLGFGEPHAGVAALGFAALGFLPAVAVHSTAQSLPSRATAVRLAGGAYALSVIAGVLHLAAAIAARSAPSRAGLIILTAGYMVVIATLAWMTRGRHGLHRALAVAGLAAFAVMAFHLAEHAAGSDSWPIELVGHHASLPLALVILYQDYRFALADIFLKRVLTLFVTITVALALYVAVAVPHVLPLAASDPLDPRATIAMLALWTSLVLIYPLVRRAIHGVVDRVILRRVDYRRLRAAIEARAASLDEPGQVLDAACAALAPPLAATGMQWREVDRRGPGSAAPASPGGGAAATIHVPTADMPAYALEIASLPWGRRLLSDDVAMLDGVALILARRIDAIRMTRERFHRTLREQEMVRLAREAELRALRAQLNPHFLFNALTTIGHLIQEAPPRALETLYRLTGLLRVVLKRSEGDFTTVGEELELVESYLAIERARFEERLRVSIDVPRELVSLRLPPFVLQPLVENAVKHGIAPRRKGGEVTIAARRAERSGDEVLLLSVSDSGVGIAPRDLARRRAEGVGLTNVERRLERHYGRRASVMMTSAPGAGTRVEICIPAVSTSTTAPSGAVLAGARG